MLRILIGFAAEGRCPNRFCGSKRGLSFSIFNFPFSINCRARRPRRAAGWMKWRGTARAWFPTGD